MSVYETMTLVIAVAPRAGAWIEIGLRINIF